MVSDPPFASQDRNSSDIISLPGGSIVLERGKPAIQPCVFKRPDAVVSQMLSRETLLSTIPYQSNEASNGMAQRLESLRESPAPKQLRHNLEMMIKKGQCTHQVYHLAQELDPTTFAFLARLDRTPQRSIDHSSCSEKPGCIAYNVDMQTYRTRHVHDACSCEMLAVPYDQLINIISKGGIPLVSVKESANSGGQLNLQLQRGHVTDSYTAISHVWADGLGNPDRNALPTCQIRRLKRQLDQLYAVNGNRQGSTMLNIRPSRLFWFDTLCIPVKNEHIYLKNRSIAYMASIYAGAKRVLVLDAELMKIESTKTETCLARVLCSAWMSRSWTLQEGTLADNCAFQFADKLYVAKPNDHQNQFTWSVLGEATRHEVIASKREEIRILEAPPAEAGSRSIVDVERCDSLLREIRQLEDISQIQRALERQLFCTFYFVQRSRDQMHVRFVYAWNALAGRSTTQANDLYFILANLLGISCQSLLAVKIPEERLPTIVFSLKKIPFSIFFNIGRRLNPDRHHFNRWVPVEPSPNVLTLRNLLKFDGTSLKLHNFQPNVDQDLSIYFVHGLIPHALTSCSIQISIENITYLIRTFPSDNDQFDTRGFHKTCIVIENVPPSLVHQVRGAVFYVSDWTTHSARDDISLVFHCPARVERIHGSQTSRASLGQHHYHAELLSRTSEISIKYGM